MAELFSVGSLESGTMASGLRQTPMEAKKQIDSPVGAMALFMVVAPGSWAERSALVLVCFTTCNSQNLWRLN